VAADTRPRDSRARLIEGSHRVDVLLTLDREQIRYRRAGSEVAIRRDRIDRIEYIAYLTAGGIPHGTLLRLSHAGQAVEFVLDECAGDWMNNLPPLKPNL
jgi:hypothetical protein